MKQAVIERVFPNSHRSSNISITLAKTKPREDMFQFLMFFSSEAAKRVRSSRQLPPLPLPRVVELNGFYCLATH